MFILNPQVSLQPQKHNRYILTRIGVMPDDILPPHLLDIDQTPPIGDIEAQYDNIGLEEGIVLGRRGVGEFESI